MEDLAANDNWSYAVDLLSSTMNWKDEKRAIQLTWNWHRLHTSIAPETDQNQRDPTLRRFSAA